LVYHVNLSTITVPRNKEVTKINPVVTEKRSKMAEKKETHSYQLTKMHKIPCKDTKEATSIST